jgi:hypothetical protein
MEDVYIKILNALYSEEYKQYFEISLHDFTAEKLNIPPVGFEITLRKLIADGFIKVNQTSFSRKNATYSLTIKAIEKKLSGGF